MKNEHLKYVGIGFLLALAVTVLIAASVPYTAFNTNQFNASGSQVSIKSGVLLTNAFNNGVAIGAGGGGDTLWTNVPNDFDSGFSLVPLSPDKSVAIGAWNGVRPLGGNSIKLTIFATNEPGTTSAGGILFDDGTGTEVLQSTYRFRSSDYSTNFSEGAAGYFQNNVSKLLEGYGVIGLAATWYDGSTNIGVAGVGVLYGGVQTNCGGYFATADDDSIRPHHQSAALVAESLGDAKPMFCAETNGHALVWIYPDRTTNATPFDFGALASLYGNWRVPDTNGLGGFVSFKASTNSGSAVLYVSGSPGSSTVRTNGNGFVFNTPGASDFTFVKGVTTNLVILGVATLNITNGVIISISGP